jgi:hypothetical protein
LPGDLFRQRRVGVADRDDVRSGKNGRQSMDLVLADHPHADDADVECHVGFSFLMRSAAVSVQTLGRDGSSCSK